MYRYDTNIGYDTYSMQFYVNFLKNIRCNTFKITINVRWLLVKCVVCICVGLNQRIGRGECETWNSKAGEAKRGKKERQRQRRLSRERVSITLVLFWCWVFLLLAVPYIEATITSFCISKESWLSLEWGKLKLKRVKFMSYHTR